MMSVQMSANSSAIAAELLRIRAQIEQRVKNEVMKSGLNIQRGAKVRCPVDTGRLRASLQLQATDNGFTITIGTAVVYGPFVEFGTRYMRPQPYLFPASEEERPRFEAAVRGALNP